MAEIAALLSKCNSARRHPRLYSMQTLSRVVYLRCYLKIQKEKKKKGSKIAQHPCQLKKKLTMHRGQWDPLDLWHDHGLLYSGRAWLGLVCVCVCVHA